MEHAASSPTLVERITVLMYHRLGMAENDWERKYTVSPERFSEHMRALAAHGYQTCSADEFYSWVRGSSSLAEGRFVLTFDDGFLGVYEHAMPVLGSLGWSATVFLVSDLIGKRDAWTEGTNPSGKTHPLLDRHHIAEMRRRGFAFHSHTRSHVDLTTISPQRLADELSGARRDLEDLLGCAVTYLAYPYGRYDERVVEATRSAGYAGAFSVQPGFNRVGTDAYRVRRLDVFGGDTAGKLLRKVRFGSNDGTLSAATMYYARRVAARLGLRGSGDG